MLGLPVTKPQDSLKVPAQKKKKPNQSELSIEGSHEGEATEEETTPRTPEYRKKER